MYTDILNIATAQQKDTTILCDTQQKTRHVHNLVLLSSNGLKSWRHTRTFQTYSRSNELLRLSVTPAVNHTTQPAT